MSAPSCSSGSTSSPIGRSRIRSMPSSVYVPSPRQHAAVRKRIAVPALPRCSSACLAEMRPPRPCTVTRVAVSSMSSSKPSVWSASSIRRVSSANSTPSSVVAPSASAAISSARLVRLFEPGGASVRSNGLAGLIRIESLTVFPHFALRNTATMFSTGTTNSRLSPSKSTGTASLGENSTRSYCWIG